MRQQQNYRQTHLVIVTLRQHDSRLQNPKHGYAVWVSITELYENRNMIVSNDWKSSTATHRQTVSSTYYILVDIWDIYSDRTACVTKQINQPISGQVNFIWPFYSAFFIPPTKITSRSESRTGTESKYNRRWLFSAFTTSGEKLELTLLPTMGRPRPRLRV